MTHWIPLLGSAETVPPEEVLAIAADLSKRLPDMRRTQGATGGLKRDPLRDVVGAALDGRAQRGSGTACFHGDELDFVLREAKAAISLQTGRAWTNNGALLAVLAAASADGIEWLLVVVPDKYKDSEAGSRIARQLAQLGESPGVDLDLAGIGLLRY